MAALTQKNQNAKKRKRTVPDGYFEQLNKDREAQGPPRKVYKSQGDLDYIQRLWQEYCEAEGFAKDPTEVMLRVDWGMVENFWTFVIDTSRGRLKCASSLRNYWDRFRILLNNDGPGVSDQLSSRFDGIFQKLVEKFNMTRQKRSLTAMLCPDLTELLKALWTDPDAMFVHERYRTQLALLLILAGTTGNRPEALIALRYRDITATLLHSLDGDDCPSLVLQMTFAKTKGYMGEKEVNTFSLPEIPQDPCLLHCPQTAFLSLAFSDDAFYYPLKPAGIFTANIGAGKYELRFDWKDSVMDTPIFRKSIKQGGRHVISPTEGLTMKIFADQLESLGKVTGMNVDITPYCFRKGAGLSLDMSKTVSEARRNLILNHKHGSGVFQNSYLSRRVVEDTQAIYRGLPQQTSLIKAAVGARRTIDKQRPTKLNKEQREEVNSHPVVQKALAEIKTIRREIRSGYRKTNKSGNSKENEAISELQNLISRTKRQHGKELLRKVRADHDREGFYLDLKQQLEGGGVQAQEDPRRSPTLPPQQVDVAEALLTMADSTDRERRAVAIERLSKLNSLQGTRNVYQKRSLKDTQGPEAGESEDASADDEEAPTLACRPTQCIFCLGTETLVKERREHIFNSRADLKKHWGIQHLPFVPENGQTKCPHPVCQEILSGRAHLQRHAHDVHGTPN